MKANRLLHPTTHQRNIIALTTHHIPHHTNATLLRDTSQRRRFRCPLLSMTCNPHEKAPLRGATGLIDVIRGGAIRAQT